MGDSDLLTVETAPQVLRAAGVLPPAEPVTVAALGGGISNVVLKVDWEDGCLVVKQSLPKLRVTADWPFVRRRTLIERDCLALLGRIVPRSVPDVMWCDERRYVLAMSCVPSGGELWKSALMSGRVDRGAAGRAGELLADIHRLAAVDEEARERFADPTVMIQGRTDPYHLTAADAHPELRPAIEREVERLLSRRVTLALGDYSPKNLFVFPDRIVAIDLEVAHWGDPAFDVAFCLTHLVLKAMHFSERADEYLAAGARFWARYRARVGDLCTEPAVVSELGCLLLARMDGKSPIEYITDEATKDRVRGLATDLILAPGTSVPAALAQARFRVPRELAATAPAPWLLG